MLVPDVSQRTVEIRASFTGAELLLFGAILYPGGRQPGRTPDVVVTLRGPTQSIRIREKARVAGIWVNAHSARFRSVPVYYAVASSRPVGDIVDERTASILRTRRRQSPALADRRHARGAGALRRGADRG